MSEPNGWSWVGTKITNSSFIVYDRGTDYGTYRYNPFQQTMVKESGEEYNPDTNPDVWRFIVATDFLVDFGTVSTIEKFTSSTASQTNGYLDYLILPYGTSSVSSTLEDVGEGYDATTDLLSSYNGDELCVLSYVNYWKEYHKTDWFLPTIAELTEVFNCKEYMVNLTREISHLEVLNSSEDFYLWSSTGDASQADYAFALNWKDGTTDWRSKTGEAKFILCRYL